MVYKDYCDLFLYLRLKILKFIIVSLINVNMADISEGTIRELYDLVLKEFKKIESNFNADVVLEFANKEDYLSLFKKHAPHYLNKIIEKGIVKNEEDAVDKFPFYSVKFKEKLLIICYLPTLSNITKNSETKEANLFVKGALIHELAHLTMEEDEVLKFVSKNFPIYDEVLQRLHMAIFH
mgnify:CR=1 FL=1